MIEELWLETPETDPHRDLYKGVIQAAAAIYQFKRGILTGAQGLYISSLVYLDKYKPTSLGLNVQRLINQMHLCFNDFKKWDRETKLLIREDSLPVLEYSFEEK